MLLPLLLTQDQRIQRLQELLDSGAFRGNKAELGRFLGYKDGAYIRQLLEAERPISEKFIAKVHEKPGYEQWFGDRTAIPENAIPVRQSKFVETPVVGGTNGGLAAVVWTDQGYPAGATGEYGDGIASSDPQAFLVPVHGPSMIPAYNPGDYALVEPNTTVDIGDEVLVRLNTGQTLIKLLAMRTQDGITLTSYNDPVQLYFNNTDVTWIYYVAYRVKRKKIKTRV